MGGKTNGQRTPADRAHERTAELLTEVNELRAAPGLADLLTAAERARDEAADEVNELREQLVQAHAETRSFLARIDALARALEASAARTAPSRKSEIEAATAKRLRAITCTDPAIDPPREAAVVSRCTWWSDPSDDFYGMCVKDAHHDREGHDDERVHENEHGTRWTGSRWEPVPAIATSGTEHLAERLRGLAIPDGDR